MSLTKRHFYNLNEEEANDYIQEIHWLVSDEWGIWKDYFEKEGED